MEFSAMPDEEYILIVAFAYRDANVVTFCRQMSL